ncbi:hypothetical protein [Acinetobacter sp.]|uniref:hypothetical protein n=1 Tax=Acinetobacter sp. TaxID=472 RepID=UPI00388E5E23
METHDDHHHNSGNPIGTLISIVLLLVGGLFGFFGWAAAVAGCRYRVVRTLMWPFTFIITQFCGGMAFLCVFGFISFVIGAHGMANYIFGHTGDLTFLTTLFGERDLPMIHIIVFQFFLWLIMGRTMGRHLSFSIYDLAIQTIGYKEGIHPYYVRERIRQEDSGYAKAEYHFTKTGKPPLLGLLLVGLSPTPIHEFY